MHMQLIRQHVPKKAAPKLLLHDRLISCSTPGCACRYLLYVHENSKLSEKEISDMLRETERDIARDCPNHRDEFWP